MKVRVQFYAQLRELIGTHELELELPQGATVRELLEKIYAQKPALRAHDKSILSRRWLGICRSQLQTESRGGNRDHAAGPRRLSVQPAGLCLSSDRNVMARATFQWANPTLLCTGNEVQEFASWSAKGHRRCFVEGLRSV